MGGWLDRNLADPGPYSLPLVLCERARDGSGHGPFLHHVSSSYHVLLTFLFSLSPFIDHLLNTQTLLDDELIPIFAG